MDYLQFDFFGDKVLLELLNGDITLPQILHGLLHVRLLFIEPLLHIFYLYCNLFYLLLGLLGLLVGAGSRNFCILKVSLQLVIFRFQLWLLFQFFGLSSSLLFLHVGKLIQQLSVICLGHARSGILGWGSVCHLRRGSSHRALALIQVSVGASHCFGPFKAHFNPGTLILALIQVNAMNSEIFIVKLRQV